MSGRNILTMGLSAALEKEKCPVCRLKRIRTEKYLWHLLYENISDPAVRERYADSKGFCQEHNHLLMKLVQSRTLAGCSSAAALLKALIPGQLQLIADLRGNLGCRSDHYNNGVPANSGSIKPGFFRGRSRWLREFSRGLLHADSPIEDSAGVRPEQSGLSCLCCQVAEGAETGYLITLTEVLSLEEYRRLYQESDGLCFPHFEKLISYINHSYLNKLSGINHSYLNKFSGSTGVLQETGEFLLRDQEQRLQKLKQGLEHLWEKQRYNYDSSLSPEEGRSWQEAIWRFTGWQPEGIISKL